jgi:hypothetical protein
MKEKKNKEYFTQKVDDAIVLYNNTHTAQKDKNRIYTADIYPVLDKLAENLINTSQVSYIQLSYEDLKHDLVVFLTEKLGKFSPSSGKAFSYFTKIGINYLIGLNIKYYKKTKEYVDLEIVDEERDITNELVRSNYLESLDSFINEWVLKVDKNIDKLFSSHVDKSIADSVLELFRQRKLLHTYNKKLLYVLIKERADVPTHKITKVVNQLKKNFEKDFLEYTKHGKT